MSRIWRWKRSPDGAEVGGSCCCSHQPPPTATTGPCTPRQRCPPQLRPQTYMFQLKEHLPRKLDALLVDVLDGHHVALGCQGGGRGQRPLGRFWEGKKVTASRGGRGAAKGEHPNKAGGFRGRTQLPTCRTDLEVAGVGEDLVLAMGGHQGAVAGAALWGRRGLGMGTPEHPVTNGAGQGQPGVCRGRCRVSSEGSAQALYAL